MLAQCAADREILAYRFHGSKDLDKTATLALKGGPSGIRTGEP